MVVKSQNHAPHLAHPDESHAAQMRADQRAWQPRQHGRRLRGGRQHGIPGGRLSSFVAVAAKRGRFLHLVRDRRWPAPGSVLRRSSGAATGAGSGRARERGLVARRQSERKESCDAYLQGRYHWKLGTPDSIRNSVAFFTKAVEADSNYAAAWAALSEALLVSSVFGLLPPSDADTRMKEAALRATSLNPSLPEAHVALGAVLSLLDWDWAGGRRRTPEEHSVGQERSHRPPCLRDSIGLPRRAGFRHSRSGARAGGGSRLAVPQFRFGLDVWRLPPL